jgi:two-component system LytT family response regulator
MPGKTGFDLLAEVEKAPRVIFTTAYDEYAIKAFEVNALDYLMKPVEPKRLSDAIQKLQYEIQKEHAGQAGNRGINRRGSSFCKRWGTLLVCKIARNTIV